MLNYIPDKGSVLHNMSHTKNVKGNQMQISRNYSVGEGYNL